MERGLSELFGDIINFRGGHVRVLGPPGSGKTSLLRDRYRRLTGKAGGARVAVITYSRRSSAFLTADLLEKNTSRFGRTPVHTYHQVAFQILSSASSGGRRVLNDMEERVVLARILNSRAISPGAYTPVIASDSFQQSVLRVFRILMQHPLASDDLDRLVENAAGARARDFFYLFRAYRNYLDRHGFFTYFDLAWRAAQLLVESPGLAPLGGVEVVMFDDFQDVDAGQYRLIQALAPPEGPIEVNVFGDPCGARFRDRGTSDSYLKQYFPAEYKPRDFFLPVFCPGEAALGSTIRGLVREIFPEQDFEEMSGGGVAAFMDVTEDETAEAQAVAERAFVSIRSGACRPEEIAVVARDKEKYERVLSRAFAERGLLLEGGRLERHGAEGFLRTLLVCVENPGDETLLAAVRNSPLYPHLLERYGEGKSVPADGRENAVVGGILARILEPAGSGKNGFDLRAFLSSSLPAVVGGQAPGSERLLSFLGTLVEEWDRYRDLVDVLGDKPSFAEFVTSSGTVTNRTTDAPAAAGRVGFYSCKELSSDRFPVVFVVGCSEFLFPRPPVRGSFFPFDSLQDCVNKTLGGVRPEFYETRSSQAHLRDEYALMLYTLTRAGRQLYLSAPQKHGGEFCPAPAFVLSGVPRHEPASVTGRRPSVALRLAAARVFAEGGDAVKAERPFAIDERRLSPSSLLTYTDCQRRYFYSKVLRIDEQKSIYLAFGGMFHTLLEKICAEYRTYEDMSGFIRSGGLDEVVDELLAENGGFNGSALVTDAARFHLKKMAHAVLELDGRRVDGFRVQATERPVEFDHRGRAFVGVIDRLDRSGTGGTAALDYKTGSSTVPKTGKTVRAKILPENKNPHERLWQVPFYCRGVFAADGEYPRAFSYYVIEAGKKPYAAGVVIGGEEDAREGAPLFESKTQSKLGYLTPHEIESCMDEAADIASEMFGPRTGFPRTEDEQQCRFCSYMYTCERDG